MSPKSAVAFHRRAGVGLGLLVLAWSGHARAADDELSLDLGAASLELRRVPKGTFVQGSPPNEVGREADESPRNVTISRSFWLGKVPVTRGQFSRFVTETRFVTDAEKGQLGGVGWDGRALVQKRDFSWRNPGFAQKNDDPVVLVTFGDANAFVAWASRKTGHRLRLPTEAEWEYAARAGTTTPWAGASSDDEALAIGWFKPNAANSTRPVARKRPNAFGLFDMSGNVHEWCRDVYAPYPPGDATDPESTTTTPEPERRVLRGGSWFRDPKRGRSAARHRAAPGARSAESGFRVAMDDDTPIVPGPAAIPVNDFAPASPVGISSASSGGGADASVDQPQSAATPSRPAPEGSGWSLVVAPLAAAGFAVVWVLARRRRRGDRSHERRLGPAQPASAASPPASEPAQPSRVTGPTAPPAPPVAERESHRAAATALVAADERASSPALPSISAVPAGSPFTSEPSIVAAPATVSEALLVRASIVEAGLFDGSIVDVPLTPIVEPKDEPAKEIVDVPLTPVAAAKEQAARSEDAIVERVPLTPVVSSEAEAAKNEPPSADLGGGGGAPADPAPEPAERGAAKDEAAETSSVRGELVSSDWELPPSSSERLPAADPTSEPSTGGDPNPGER